MCSYSVAGGKMYREKKEEILNVCIFCAIVKEWLPALIIAYVCIQ